MRKLLFYFLLIGCINHNTPVEDIDTQVWICKNEESEHHNLLCHDDCYEPGDPFKFCWFLEIQTCREPNLPFDVKQACNIFDENNI